MAIFDATALLHFLEPNAPAPLDPGTNTPVEDAQQRIGLLIETLQEERETILIPTPARSTSRSSTAPDGSGSCHSITVQPSNLRR